MYHSSHRGRISTHYASKLKLPTEAFDVILRRRSLGYIHTAFTPDINNEGIFVRMETEVAKNTLEVSFGLQQRPNPVSFNWIGEAWEDYAGLRVAAPSNILLDHTPVTSIGTFRASALAIESITTSLITDNPSFLRYAAIIFWVK